MTKPILRMATLEDAKEILNIYNPYIENTCITFEYNLLSLEDFRARMAGIMERFPYIVCELDGKIAGYAYTSPAHTRAAYSWNCDISIYLDSNLRGQGLGTLLYRAIFDFMKEMGYYNIYALVTSANPASLAFHKKLGFEVECVSENTGFKFGKWLNVTHLVKRIGDFSKAPDPVKTIHEVDAEAILARCQKY